MLLNSVIAFALAALAVAPALAEVQSLPANGHVVVSAAAPDADLFTLDDTIGTTYTITVTGGPARISVWTLSGPLVSVEGTGTTRLVFPLPYTDSFPVTVTQLDGPGRYELDVRSAKPSPALLYLARWAGFAWSGTSCWVDEGVRVYESQARDFSGRPAVFTLLDPHTIEAKVKDQAPRRLTVTYNRRADELVVTGLPSVKGPAHLGLDSIDTSATGTRSFLCSAEQRQEASAAMAL